MPLEPYIIKGKGKLKGVITTKKIIASKSTYYNLSLFKYIKALKTTKVRVL